MFNIGNKFDFKISRENIFEDGNLKKFNDEFQKHSVYLKLAEKYLYHKGAVINVVDHDNAESYSPEIF